MRYFYDVTGLKRIRLLKNNSVYDYECVKDSQGSIVMLVNIQSGKVSCRYEYDALGNCTVLEDDGDVAQLNPFRWKGFFFDSETGFYYANGSYYDPETGLYVDAAPVSVVLENSDSPKHIDRCGTLCYNALEIEGSPYTAATTVTLSEDPSYDPGKTWWEKLCENWRNTPNWLKVVAGLALVVISIALAFLTGGTSFAAQVAVKALVEVAIGVGIATAAWAIGSAISGNWDANGLWNSIADAVFFSGLFLFVQTGISAIKYSSRTLAPYELDPRSIELAKQGDPSWEVFRKRVWQYEAVFNRGAYSRRQLKDMVKGLAPKIHGESMHLHHVVGKSVNLYYVIKVTPAQHIAIHKAIGYLVNKPKLAWTLKNAIKFGGLL